jgi:predicted transcriptional regulator
MINEDHRAFAYVRFLQFFHSMKDRPAVPMLDSSEQRLLEVIAVAWQRGKPLSVTEAMSVGAIGAPASVHRRLRRLRELGLIQLETTHFAPIKKLVVPTETALDYFSELADCLHEATNF